MAGVVLAGVRVARRAQRPHLAEAGEGERQERRLRARAEHDVRLAAHDRLHRLADGVAAGRAGADDRGVRPADAELDRDLAGWRVGEHVRQHERADPARAALEEGLVAVEQQADAADPGPEHHPEAVGVHVAGDMPVVAEQAGVAQGLARGGHGEVRAAVVAAGVLRIHVVGRLEALHLAGDVDVERRRVEERDAVDPRAAGHQAVPRRLGTDPDRRDDAQAGHHRAAVGHAGVSRKRVQPGARIGQVDRVGHDLGVDAADQAGEDAAGADLDEVGDAAGGHAAHAGGPLDPVDEVLGELAAQPVRRVDDAWRGRCRASGPADRGMGRERGCGRTRHARGA